jgi:membrane protein
MVLIVGGYTPGMKRVKSVLGRLDDYQQHHPWAGFPYAVVKKYGDDQSGNQAALITYYGFLSLFPLLLVAVSVLGIVLAHNPDLQRQVLDSALKNFPVLGTQLRHNVHSLDRTGLALALGLAGTFYGARGVASAAQNAFNHSWHVPKSDRPGFPLNTLRSFGLIMAVGGGVIVTTALSGLGAGGGSGTSAVLRVGAFVLSFLLNIGVFWLAFRLGTAKSVAGRDLIVASVAAAVSWQVLQALGTFLVAHELQNASQVYGTFAFVIGLMWWIYMQAQFTLYALEIDVVRARKLWPRSLVQPPLTEADERAFQLYAEEEKRREPHDVNVRPNEPVKEDAPAGAPARSTRSVA